MELKIITTREELIAFDREHGLGDWHEPDEQGITARVFGTNFDNAGGWAGEEVRTDSLYHDAVEMHVVFYKEHDDERCEGCGHTEPVAVAAVSLATLCSWAAGYTGR